MEGSGSAIGSVPPRRLRIFISYGAQDLNLAYTLVSCLNVSLGEFAEINLERWFGEIREYGEYFRRQVEEKLQASDILIIISTDQYTGWEVGFFEGLGHAAQESDGKRRLIPLYVGNPPEVISSYQGVNLDIPNALLQLDEIEFAPKDLITPDQPLCRFIKELQDIADEYRKAAGFARMQNRPDPIEAARKIRLEVFRTLKDKTVSRGQAFLSYASPDREFAKSLATALRGEGVSVWWDRTIPPGKTFDEVIEKALDAAKCVIVLWSASSVGSDWVKNEAREGLRRHILIPALMAETKIPFEFRHIQAADLAGWPAPDHAGFRSLVDSIQEMERATAEKASSPS